MIPLEEWSQHLTVASRAITAREIYGKYSDEYTQAHSEAVESLKRMRERIGAANSRATAASGGRRPAIPMAAGMSWQAPDGSAGSGSGSQEDARCMRK